MVDPTQETRGRPLHKLNGALHLPPRRVFLRDGLRECPECQSRESCRSHTASVSPADVRSDPIDSLAVEEILKTLRISVGSLSWRNTKISPLRLWTPPVHRMPVRTGWRSDAYSPKAGKQTAIDKLCNLRERRLTARSSQGPRNRTACRENSGYFGNHRNLCNNSTLSWLRRRVCASRRGKWHQGGASRGARRA